MVNRASQRQVNFLLRCRLATLHFLDSSISRRETKKKCFCPSKSASGMHVGWRSALFWIFQTRFETHLRRLSSAILSVACYSLRKRLDPLSFLQQNKTTHKNWIKITYSIKWVPLSQSHDEKCLWGLKSSHEMMAVAVTAGDGEGCPFEERWPMIDSREVQHL